mmetsp:Transcript_30652/g.76263  ORF Transcript_30652/g.76263 Transcript_30652/m.76263 type:complete len:281 (-) Transcript_30652:736-1578(-)
MPPLVILPRGGHGPGGHDRAASTGDPRPLGGAAGQSHVLLGRAPVAPAVHRRHPPHARLAIVIAHRAEHEGEVQLVLGRLVVQRGPQQHLAGEARHHRRLAPPTAAAIQARHSDGRHAQLVGGTGGGGVLTLGGSCAARGVRLHRQGSEHKRRHEVAVGQGDERGVVHGGRRRDQLGEVRGLQGLELGGFELGEHGGEHAYVGPGDVAVVHHAVPLRSARLHPVAGRLLAARVLLAHVRAPRHLAQGVHGAGQARRRRRRRQRQPRSVVLDAGLSHGSEG